MDGRVLRVVRAVLCVVLGVVVGTAAVVVHALTPGLVLGVLATVATAVALPGGWDTRLAFALGWVGVCGYVMVPRAAGDYLIAADTRGYLLLGFALALVLVSILTVRPLRPPRPPAEAPPRATTSDP